MEIDRILLTREQLQTRVCELGKTLSADYADKKPVFIAVLRGAVHFFADLMQQFPHPCQYDFVGAASYGDGTQTSGKVQLTKDVVTDLRGRHVVIVEDILDTGLTLRFVTDWLESKQPASLKLCVLERVRGRLRTGLSGTVPQPALYRDFEAIKGERI